MRRQNSPLIWIALLSVLFLVPGCKKEPTVVAAPPRAPEVAPPPTDPPPVPAPTIDLTASPTAVDRGGQTTLSWTSSNANSVVIDSGVGNVSGQGSIVVSPRQSTTYTAVARGGGREARDSARVTVVEPREDLPPVASDAQKLKDMMESGQLKAVFFDYDKAELGQVSRETLRANALLFRQNPGARIVIEGHCDERGTESYNLALGDNRAQAVYDYLIQLGIPSSRMETISFGEERPFALGADEAAFASNRRAHFSFR